MLGHGGAVFVLLQQLHLFAAGFGAQDEANGRFLARPEATQVFGVKAPARRCLLSNADVPIPGINVAMDAMPPL